MGNARRRGAARCCSQALFTCVRARRQNRQNRAGSGRGLWCQTQKGLKSHARPTRVGLNIARRACHGHFGSSAPPRCFRDLGAMTTPRSTSPPPVCSAEGGGSGLKPWFRGPVSARLAAPCRTAPCAPCRAAPRAPRRRSPPRRAATVRAAAGRCLRLPPLACIENPRGPLRYQEVRRDLRVAASVGAPGHSTTESSAGRTTRA